MRDSIREQEAHVEVRDLARLPAMRAEGEGVEPSACKHTRNTQPQPILSFVGNNPECTLQCAEIFDSQ